MQRIYDNGYVYKGLYEGWYCPRCADFKVENEILEGNRCPIHEIVLTRESEENWFFKLSAFQEPLEQLFAEHPDFVMPARAMNEARAFVGAGPQGHLAVTREADLGRHRALGPEPRLLRLVRRAPQLLHGARLRPPGRGSHRPLLARAAARDRQGHPQVPHDLLAGDAAGGRDRGARARLRPRLPDGAGRAQDEQVAGQRARPVRGASTSSAPTRCAST